VILVDGYGSVLLTASERFMGRLGLTEVLVILVIALLLFGASRISDIGKGLGEGIKNFKKGLKDDEEPPGKLPPKKADEPPAEKSDEKPA
jgi:sec-independent protein translocase protein TatA